MQSDVLPICWFGSRGDVPRGLSQSTTASLLHVFRVQRSTLILLLSLEAP